MNRRIEDKEIRGLDDIAKPSEHQNPNTSNGVWSLTTGIISLITCWTPIIPLVMGIMAIVTAVQQRRVQSTGCATAGLVLGILGLVFGSFYSLIYLMVLLGVVLAQIPSVMS